MNSTPTTTFVTRISSYKGCPILEIHDAVKFDPTASDEGMLRSKVVAFGNRKASAILASLSAVQAFVTSNAKP